jgi:hypothetical protein
MMLFVGQASIKGDFRKYAKHFNYVELLAEPQVLPNVKKLMLLAKENAERVKFGVVLSPRAWGTEEKAFRAYFDKVVKATNPVWVVVRTPSSLRPGTASERQLQQRFEDLRAKIGAATLAWEPRGLWEPAAIARVARELGVVPVWDGFSPPGFSLGEGDNYVRFSALGVAGRVNEGRLERLAVQAQDSKALFVVVEGKGALKTRQLLSALLEDPFVGVDGALGLADAELAEGEVEFDDDDASLEDEHEDPADIDEDDVETDEDSAFEDDDDAYEDDDDEDSKGRK